MPIAGITADRLDVLRQALERAAEALELLGGGETHFSRAARQALDRNEITASRTEHDQALIDHAIDQARIACRRSADAERRLAAAHIAEAEYLARETYLQRHLRDAAMRAEQLETQLAAARKAIST